MHDRSQKTKWFHVGKLRKYYNFLENIAELAMHAQTLNTRLFPSSHVAWLWGICHSMLLDSIYTILSTCSILLQCNLARVKATFIYHKFRRLHCISLLSLLHNHQSLPAQSPPTSLLQRWPHTLTLTHRYVTCDLPTSPVVLFPGPTQLPIAVW